MRNSRKEQIISALPLPAQPVDAAVRLTRRLSPEERVRKVIEIIGTQVAQPREVESAVSRLLEDISRHQAQRRRRSKQRLKKWGRDFRRAARKLQMLFAKRPFELRSRDGFEVHFGSEPFDSERFARELGR